MGDKEATAKVDLGLLEEDDEFEEFPADDTDANTGEETTVNVWEDNWDDDKKEDDFANQLRAMERMVGGSGLERGAVRVRGEEDTPPPPAKKRCTVSTPPTQPSNGSQHGTNGSASNGADLETELAVGSAPARRSSRSASSRGSGTASPPASPARRSGRRPPAEQPATPTRSSGRLRKS